MATWRWSRSGCGTRRRVAQVPRDALSRFAGPSVRAPGCPVRPTPPSRSMPRPDRPQPRLDIERGGGMAVTVGRHAPLHPARLPLRRARPQHHPRRGGRRGPDRASSSRPRDGSDDGRRMIVCKFGGTSVQDAAAMLRLAKIVAARARRTAGVVVSALARVTDTPRGAAPRASGRGMARRWKRRWTPCSTATAQVADDTEGWRGGAPGPRRRRGRPAPRAASRDRPRAHAGRARPACSGRARSGAPDLVAAALASAGMPVTWVDARQVIITDDRHGRATPQQDAIREAAATVLAPLLAAGRIPLTQGFIGANAAGPAHHPGPRRLRLHRVAARCGARRRAGRDLDRRERPHDRRPAHRARGAHPGLRDLRRGRRARHLRRQGAAPRHPAAARGGGYPDRHPQRAARRPARHHHRAHACIGAPGGRARSARSPGSPAPSVVNVRAPRMLGAYGFLRAAVRGVRAARGAGGRAGEQRGERVADGRGPRAGSTRWCATCAARRGDRQRGSRHRRGRGARDAVHARASRRASSRRCSRPTSRSSRRARRPPT